MKIIKAIILIIIFAVVSFVVGTLLKYRYDTRYERATEQAVDATEDSIERDESIARSIIQDERATAAAESYVEAASICNHVIATQGRGNYSGQVFVCEENATTKSLGWLDKKLLYFGDQSLYEPYWLQDADAILCVKFLGTQEKDCKFNVPTTTVHFIYAQAEFTLVAWPSGEFISREMVSGYDPQCPNSWSGMCENGRCVGYDRINVDAWLEKFLVSAPSPTSVEYQAGGVCWTYQLENFVGNRFQVWESLLDDETKRLLAYDQFLVDVVIQNPQLEADGYVFYGDKTYILPELCP